jgi:ABC-2 type transport system permease protein
MNKILLIIQREYLTRVKKKSFIVMTILGPLLMATLFVSPILIAKFSKDQDYKIKIIDESPKIFTTLLPGNESISFVNDTISLKQAKDSFDADKYYGILYIPADIVRNSSAITLITDKQANIQVKSYIERTLQKQIEDAKLKSQGIDKQLLESIKTEINLKTISLGGKQSNVELTTAVGFIAGILIYMFIFLYGVQVMRGVIEEKTNRIVEVIISSVKPFQLMMGKIIGIALVGLTQFLLWIIITFSLSTAAGAIFNENKFDAQKIAMQSGTVNQVENINSESSKADINTIFENLDSINFTLILTCFLFYFLGGYLLYSALFAAIGAAVDNETETQQFMLPVTIPLIFSFIVAQTIITNPDSQLGFWFSIIPLTSPVVMMVRIAFGVPPWEIALSMGLLIVGFLVATWIAAKIYRTGILLYGKKITYKELSKWLFYKD